MIDEQPEIKHNDDGDEGGFDICSFALKDKSDRSPLQMLSHDLIAHYKAVEQEARNLLQAQSRLHALLYLKERE
jgi:hypothetical protein